MTNMKKRLLKLISFDVRKKWLHFTAGILWFGVGLMLIGFASRWLKPVGISTLLALVLAGLILAGAIYYFGFSKLARKNIHRINGFDSEKVCLFAFQAWTSYPLVAFMIALGIYLRLYSPMPKSMLAILYMGIGGGLFSSSFHYFKHFARSIRPEVSRS